MTAKRLVAADGRTAPFSRPGGVRKTMTAKRLAAAALMTLVLAALLGGCAPASRDGGGDDDPLRGLTLEQKVGQLFVFGFEGTAVTPELEEWFRDVHPGGVILFARNIEDEEQLEGLVRDLQELARADSGLPLLVAVDQEGGEVTRLRWLEDGVPQSRIAGPEQAYAAGLARAKGLSKAGVNLNLAPVLDMGVDGDFLTRYGRAFAGNPQEVGELGRSAISGQRDGGVLSAAKHFPGYGGIGYDPENDRLAVLPSVPETSQFGIAAEAGPEFIMTANVVYSEIDPNLPFTLSPAGIESLKRDLAGDYLVISDDLSTKVLKEAYALQGTVVGAAKAGVDVLLVCGHEAGECESAYAALLDAVRGGVIPEEEIDARVRKLADLKRDLGG